MKKTDAYCCQTALREGGAQGLIGFCGKMGNCKCKQFVEDAEFRESLKDKEIEGFLDLSLTSPPYATSRQDDDQDTMKGTWNSVRIFEITQAFNHSGKTTCRRSRSLDAILLTLQEATQG